MTPNPENFMAFSPRELVAAVDSMPVADRLILLAALLDNEMRKGVLLPDARQSIALLLSPAVLELMGDAP